MTDGTQRLGILTSGGDAPGMNAAIRAATLIGRSLGYEIIGIERGYRGLVDGSFLELQPADVQGILRDGGTVLGSARCLEFHELSVRQAACRKLAEQNIRSLLVIGGNGSFAGARALSELPGAPAVLGLPASIDNDLAYTGLSIGVDTAMNTIVEAIDKIVDTAGAHDRTFIVEVMGRDCGYLAMTSALATGADLALFPEAGRSEQDIVDATVSAILSVRARRRRHRVIIVKAEGVKVPAERLKLLIDERLQAQGIVPETRVTVLGHVVRGGRPSAFDRLMPPRHQRRPRLRPGAGPQDGGLALPAPSRARHPLLLRSLHLARRSRRRAAGDRQAHPRREPARPLEDHRLLEHRERPAPLGG
jgi:6-phosphofructokinase 1